MRLVAAYRAGRTAALDVSKTAGTLGADYGVAPRGEETSHGSSAIPYPERRNDDGTDPDMSQWLWDMFGRDKEAPGSTDGQYGAETVG